MLAHTNRDRPRRARTVPIPRPALLGSALAAVLTVSLLHAPQAAADPEGPQAQESEAGAQSESKRQMRAEWIAGVQNIDWPTEAGLSAEEQQAELTELYDGAVDKGLNAVVVQVRPTADAFWPSPHEPWSEWLTGEQGGDPGYDPLEFAVEEAHARNLEFHAWYNPYRVAMHDDPSLLVEDHPARQNPEWTFSYGGQLYYDPGVPEAREFVVEAMMHSVDNYDLDGVHFDDYFYPYPVEGEQIPDEDTYAEHGQDFDDVGDWRRDNVNTMVREVSEAIDESKPHVKFGISPFGIWRNSSTDPDGSDTNGMESYDDQYADSRTWVTEGWLDYINPQIYWEIGLDVADYSVLVPWWEELASANDTHLYIGQGAYKVGEQEGPWTDNPNELSDHLTFNQDYDGVHGDVYFSATSLRNNAQEAFEIVQQEHYANPALIPVKEDLGGEAPGTPSVDGSEGVEGGLELSLAPADGSEPAYYAVYAVDGAPVEDPDGVIGDAGNLLGTARAGEDGTATFTAPEAEGERTFYVTALDRLHHESEASEPHRS